MRRCIFVSSLFRTFPESRRQVLNLNAEMTSLVALNQSFSPHRVERESNPLCCWRADGECSTEIQQLVRSRFWLAPFSARKTSRPIAFSWVSLRFLDRLLPNVNVVPSRLFFVPIGFTLFTGRPHGSKKKRRSCAILR